MKTYSMGVMFRSVTVLSILFSIVLSQETTSKQQPRSVTKIFQQKYEEKTEVLTGLDILLEKKYYFIQGKAIALVTNQTGVDKVGIPNYQRFKEMEDVGLKVIFTPEKDLFDKIDYYLSHEREMRTVAENGFNKLLKYHTSEDRAKEFIETCERYIDD